MPLIILGLIVVVSACLLIYYQFGPAISRRLNPGPDSGRRNDYKGGAGAPSGSDENESKYETSEDGKVVFLFGNGERDEQPLEQADVIEDEPGTEGEPGDGSDDDDDSGSNDS